MMSYQHHSDFWWKFILDFFIRSGATGGF